MCGARLVVEIMVQALAVGGLAMGKGMLAGLIECVTVGQLRLSKGSKLLRSGHQFQFGGDGGLHSLCILFQPQQIGKRRCFLPRLKTVGIRTAQSHEQNTR